MMTARKGEGIAVSSGTQAFMTARPKLHRGRILMNIKCKGQRGRSL